MLVSYKITKTVNLPDQVGVNDNGKVLMVNCDYNDCAMPGSYLAKYEGALYDKYDMSVVIDIEGLDDLSISVKKNASKYYYDDDGEYCEGADIIFYTENVNEKNILEVLGNAFAAVEKELSSRKKECPKTEEKKSSRGDTPIDDFLRRLRNSLNSILNE